MNTIEELYEKIAKKHQLPVTEFPESKFLKELLATVYEQGYEDGRFMKEVDTIGSEVYISR